MSAIGRRNERCRADVAGEPAPRSYGSMTKLRLRARRLLPSADRHRRRARAAAAVTPMTPDIVASYNPVLPEADYIKRDRNGADARRDQALHRHRHEEGHERTARSCCRARPTTPRAACRERRASRSSTSCPIMYKEFVNDGYIIVQQDIRGMHTFGRAVRHEPPDRRAAQPHRHRREHRRLRHHRLAGEERAGIQRQGRRRSARPTSAS